MRRVLSITLALEVIVCVWLWPTNVRRDILKGYELVAAGELPAALDLANGLIAKNSQLADAYRIRAWALIKQERPETAVIDLDLIIDRDPKDAWALEARGLSLIKLGHPQFALLDFVASLRLEPVNAIALQGMKYCLSRGKNDEPALAELRELIGTVGESASAKWRTQSDRVMAWALNSILEFEQGEALARKAVEHDPPSGLAHRELGISLLNVGKIAEAKGHLDRATREFPDDERARSAHQKVVLLLADAKELEAYLATQRAILPLIKQAQARRPKVLYR